MAVGVLLFATSLSAAQDTAPLLGDANEPEAALPSAAELEQRGVIIGEILFRVNDVFDVTNPKENNRLFRAANHLHITTKQSVIANQLLFKTGDPFIQSKLDESERILRSNGFLYDADIRPVRYHGNQVDIEVTTRDVWTLTGGINFSKKGGENNSGFEIQDQNVLGLGKQISLHHSKDTNRSENLFEYTDPLLTEYRLKMKIGYSKNSDGSRKTFKLERPFFSLDSRWSFGLETENAISDDTLYRDNEIFQRYKHREENYGIFGGYSVGSQINRSERFTFGFSSEEVAYSTIPETFLDRPVPANRAIAFPWVGFSRIDHQFIKAKRIDLIERTEDINLGTVYDIRIGASNEVFGALNNRLILEGSLSTGDRVINKDTLLLSAFSLSSRFGNAQVENALFSTRLRFFTPVQKYQVSYARLQFDVGHDLDEDTQLLLGGRNGLRGYPSNYREGNRRFLLTLEQRFYGTWHIWQLFYVGAAAFFDLGSAWQNEARQDQNYQTLRDYGLGLRVSSSRSGRGQVLHFDIAYALDGDESIDKRQTIVSMESTF